MTKIIKLILAKKSISNTFLWWYIYYNISRIKLQYTVCVFLYIFVLIQKTHAQKHRQKQKYTNQNNRLRAKSNNQHQCQKWGDEQDAKISLALRTAPGEHCYHYVAICIEFAICKRLLILLRKVVHCNLLIQTYYTHPLTLVNIQPLWATKKHTIWCAFGFLF